MSNLYDQNLLKCHNFDDIILLKSQIGGVANVIPQDRIHHRITPEGEFQADPAY